VKFYRLKKINKNILFLILGKILVTALLAQKYNFKPF
jgi:hypothetical protein